MPETNVPFQAQASQTYVCVWTTEIGRKEVAPGVTASGTLVECATVNSIDGAHAFIDALLDVVGINAQNVYLFDPQNNYVEYRNETPDQHMLRNLLDLLRSTPRSEIAHIDETRIAFARSSVEQLKRQIPFEPIPVPGNDTAN